MVAKTRLIEMMDADKNAIATHEAAIVAANARISAFHDLLQHTAGTAGDTIARRLNIAIKREQTDVTERNKELVTLRERVTAFEEALRWFPKNGEDGNLREGTQMADIRDIIRKAGKPLTLTEILKALNLEGDDKKKNSIRGSLAGYAREGRVFTKEQEPDTFGLLEFKKQTEISVEDTVKKEEAEGNEQK